ncbi:MAG: anhydro-N-acetylmuramic acid kinase, partial [Bacteroidota bacterium]|nr:anhydro-N-acetylmuramic acid kinase [Bacteroidota bacterium]
LQITNVIMSQNLKTGLFSGGGVLNSFLMQRIAQILDRPIPPTNRKLIHYKEALVFGFLGVLKLRQEINCLRSVTGAIEDHSSGKIYYPSQRVNA